MGRVHGEVQWDRAAEVGEESRRFELLHHAEPTAFAPLLLLLDLFSHVYSFGRRAGGRSFFFNSGAVHFLRGSHLLAGYVVFKFRNEDL